MHQQDEKLFSNPNDLRERINLVQERVVRISILVFVTRGSGYGTVDHSLRNDPSSAGYYPI